MYTINQANATSETNSLAHGHTARHIVWRLDVLAEQPGALAGIDLSCAAAGHKARIRLRRPRILWQPAMEHMEELQDICMQMVVARALQQNVTVLRLIVSSTC
jgi:hypothetical protein